MINALFTGLLNFFTQIITVLLTPINLLLASIVPDLATTVSTINQFWLLLSGYGRFVLSYTGLTTEVITIIITLLIANIVVPWSVHGLKLVAKWWETLI